MFDVKATLIAAAVAAGVALGAAGAWVAQDWRYGAIINKNDADAKAEQSKRDRINLERINKLQVDRDDLARRIAKLDGDYAGKLQALQNENTDLNDCLRNGKCKLRINPAICPTGRGAASVPAPASAPGVANATGPGPDEDVRQDYLNLRGALKAAQLQIQGLQDYINTTRRDKP